MTQKYTDYSQLPLSLRADDVAQVLGISRANAYCLMHSRDFPTIFIGKRMIVPKEKFLAWLDSSAGKPWSLLPGTPAPEIRQGGPCPMVEQKPWFVTHKFSFCAVPKAFFSQPRYQKLSTDAKMLYALLLDRSSLSYSHREKWTDGQQRIYIVFSQAEIAQKLNCGHDKATKVMRELEQAGLVRRGPQRRGQTARIYVLPFDKVCGKTASVNAENPQQPLRENRTAHCGKTAGKDPEEYPEEYAPHTGRDEICRRIRENIAYDILKDELPVAKLDMIVSVMTELACQQAPSVRIGDRTRQRDELNAQILSMDDMSIRYVCDVLENTRVPIQSPRNYIRAILSNATEGFIECYYDSRVNHDLGALPIQKKP